MKISFLLPLFVFSISLSFGFQGPVLAKGSDEGKALFESRCSTCHGTGRITSKKKSEIDWRSTVERMKRNGATLNDEETKLVIEHLTQKYGKK